MEGEKKNIMRGVRADGVVVELLVVNQVVTGSNLTCGAEVVEFDHL